MSECFRCGKQNPVRDKLCGLCFYEIVTKRRINTLRYVEELKDQHLNMLRDFMVDVTDAVLQASREEMTLEISKIMNETTVERDGTTYGISMMIKPLNEAEEEAWEDHTTVEKE